MLLGRGQEIETCLVHHGLLLVFELEPFADGLMQRHSFFLDAEAMRVDILDHSQRCLQVLSLRSDSLWVAWLQGLSEVLELRLEIDLELRSAGRVFWDSGGACLWLFRSGAICDASCISPGRR